MLDKGLLLLVGVALGFYVIGKKKSMYNYSKKLAKFHNEKVLLTSDQVHDLRKKRKANRDKIRKYCETEGRPKPHFWGQGSFAMKTVIQDLNNAYDIDDGCYFKKSDLEAGNGKYSTPKSVKSYIRDAVSDTRLKQNPEIKTNCVRVTYNEGYHVDIPCYREVIEESFLGEERKHYELASSEWKKSDPKKVTDWFQEQVNQKSPDHTNGQQLRRIVRLLKKFANSRPSWQARTPSGFALSVLAVDCYRPTDGRDDIAFYLTIDSIKKRIEWDTTVKHPIQEYNLADSDDAKVKFLLEKIEQNIPLLSDLYDIDNDQDAAQKWGTFFNENAYFDGLENSQKSASVRPSIRIVDQEPERPVSKKDGGRYA